MIEVDRNEAGARRWEDRPGRLEVWYLTATDRATGDGLWIHHELVAPTAGRGAPYAHGWLSWFPGGNEASTVRFGPVPVPEPAETAARDWWSDGCGTVGTRQLCGAVEGVAWDLHLSDAGSPLWTFPRQVWRHHVLPGAQVVPVPSARVVGTVTLSGAEHRIDGHGAIAHIFGHGNAQRWGWLHADLGAGAVLEIVAATPRTRPLRWLPPVALVQLRRGGRDWPGHPLAGATVFRTRLRPDGFSVRGRVGRRRLAVDVTLPPGGTVRLEYTDPDGASAYCTNSERANATVRLDRWKGRWHAEGSWELDGTAHAEVGSR